MEPWLWLGWSYELGSVYLSFWPEVFLGLAHQFFLRLSMVLEAHVVLCLTEPDILKILFALGKKSVKIILFAAFLYKSHTWDKNLVPEIWPKILWANQVAGFLNRLYLCNKVMKYLIFWMLVQIHGNWKLIEKYWVGRGQKRMWPLWSQGTKVME